MIVSSIPVYFVFIAWKNKPKCFQRGVGKYRLKENSPERKFLTAEKECSICHLEGLLKFAIIVEFL